MIDGLFDRIVKMTINIVTLRHLCVESDVCVGSSCSIERCQMFLVVESLIL